MSALAPAPLLLASSLRPENDPQCLCEDHEVQEQAVVLDVVEIILQLLDSILDRGTIRIVNLRPPRDPGFHTVPILIKGDVLRKLVHDRGALRARSDEAH